MICGQEFEMGFSFKPTMPLSGRHKTGKDKTSFFYESIHHFDSDVNIKEVFVELSITLNRSEVIIGPWAWKSTCDNIAVMYFKLKTLLLRYMER